MSEEFESRSVVNSSGCMLYVRTELDVDRLAVFAFKHDQYRCDFQIFYDDCGEEFKDWAERLVCTDDSF